MSIYTKKSYFSHKLFKSGFVAYVKWREDTGFGMLHHKADK